MNALDTNRITHFAPYKVWREGNEYRFDSANGQQAMRSRLFLRWFNAYAQQQDFYIRTEMVTDEGEENYIALIVQRTHPKLQTIIETFDTIIEQFKANKPQ